MFYINKYIEVGIITSIIIKRDKRNNTYKNNMEFINDKVNILNIINKYININLFNISINDNSIILNFNKNIIIKNINNIRNYFLNNYLFNFIDCINNSNNIIFNSIFDNYAYSFLDTDYNSKYSPVMLETRVIGLFRTRDKIGFNNKDKILILFKSYNDLFIDSDIKDLIIYGIDM